MDLTRREYSMHGHNSLLKDFIHHNETRLKKLQDDARISQVQKNFELCELFGADWAGQDILNRALYLSLSLCFPGKILWW